VREGFFEIFKALDSVVEASVIEALAIESIAHGLMVVGVGSGENPIEFGDGFFVFARDFVRVCEAVADFYEGLFIVRGEFE